jgi:HAD superfamily hydrolase (TIGR01509 family)
VDGTLSDTDNLYVQKAAPFFPRLFFKDPQYSARRFVMWMEAPGNAVLGLTDTLGLDNEMVALAHWLELHRKRQSREFLLIPGVDEVLRQLHGRFPMAIVSARDEQGTMAFLERFDLVKYFDAIITGLSAKHTKPYPDPIYLAAQRMNVSAENCVMIGDTTVDVRAGKSAGAQVIGVLCGFGEEAELKKFGANLILPDTPKILEVLK